MADEKRFINSIEYFKHLYFTLGVYRKALIDANKRIALLEKQLKIGDSK
jgi:hypothetical protein